VAIPALWRAAAWDSIKFAAKYVRQLVSDLRNRDVEFQVSRGYAALLAIEHLLDEGAEDGVIDVERSRSRPRSVGAHRPRSTMSVPIRGSCSS
jgi:hypothetical protein